MVIASSGEFVGSVSGGCVEAAVVQAALEMLAANDPALTRGEVLEYRISNSAAADPNQACGGQILVHLRAAPAADDLAALIAELDAGPAVLVTDLATGVVQRLAPDAIAAPLAAAAADVLAERSGRVVVVAPPLAAAAAEALAERGARIVVVDGQRQFVEAVLPPRRLVIVGGTHIAQKLCLLARAVGFAPVVVDPREGFANPRRFGNTALVVDAPARALPGLIDARTAVVTLTHRAEFDDPALIAALASPAFYVGALGSKQTHAARLHRLQEAGVPARQLARLHGPAGVPIGGVGAGEIALSMLAEIVAVRRSARPTLRVGAVVLAAGLSRRAGVTTKLLHPIGGEPMVVRAVRNVLDAGVGPVLVVLGHEAAAVRAALAHLPVEFVVNDSFADGIGASVAAGIRAIAAHDVSAALVVLGDMPFVRPADIARLAAVHDSATRELIVVPHATPPGEPAPRAGNPVLWPRRCFDELAALSGDMGGKPLLQRHAATVLAVPIDDTGVLRDLDQPADLLQASDR